MDALPRRLAAFAFSLLVVSLATVRADDPPLEIAAIISMTGAYGQVGLMEARAIETEVKITNANGGIHGRLLTLHVFDDESNTGRAYMLADRVIAAKQAAVIIGGSTTPTCDAIHLATSANNVVQYCLSGGSATGSEYFTSFAEPQHVFGDLPAAFFAEHRLRRVAMIVPDNHAGAIYEHALTAAVAANGLELVSVAHVSSDEEAAAATGRALRTRPDVIYVGGNTDIESAALRTVRGRRKKTTMWLVDSANGSMAADTFAGMLPRGPVYSAGDAIAVAQQLPSFDPQRAALMSFWGMFAHYNNGLAANTYAAVAADAAVFVISGLRNNGGIGGPPLAEAIENLPPAVGLYSTYRFGPQRHNPAEPSGIIVRLHRDGSLKYVETLQAQAMKTTPAQPRMAAPVETTPPQSEKITPAVAPTAGEDHQIYSNDAPQPQQTAPEVTATPTTVDSTPEQPAPAMSAAPEPVSTTAPQPAGDAASPVPVPVPDVTAAPIRIDTE